MKTDELPWGINLGVTMEEAVILMEKYDGQLEVSYQGGGCSCVKVSCCCGQWEYKGSASSLADALTSTIRGVRAVIKRLEKEEAGA